MADNESHVLRPFNVNETIPVSIAARLASVSTRTIQHWCAVHHIGRRIGGRGHWRVSRVALSMHLEGDTAALGQYLQGDRTSSLVLNYFRSNGVKPQ